MRLRLLTIPFVLYTLPATAEHIGPSVKPTLYEKCIEKADPSNDAQMEDCARASLNDLDSQLNHEFHAKMEGGDDRFRNALREAQRKWIAYRDTSCALASGTYLPNNGSLDRLVETDCLRKDTQDRIDFLHHLKRDE